MTAVQRSNIPSPTATHWPLDFEHYDRRHALDSTEKEALEYWCNHRGRGYGVVTEESQEALQRPLKPLDDAIALIEFPGKYAGLVGIQVILLEMQRRQTSYWAWTSNDWLEILGKSHSAFKERFNQEHGRQQVLAIIYVLLGFMDFDAIRFEKSSLARKVFGSQQLDASTQIILDALVKQGYKADGKEIHKYRAVISEIFLLHRSIDLNDLTPESLDRARQQIPRKQHRQSFVAISVALERLGVLSQSLYRIGKEPSLLGSRGALDQVSSEWAEFCTEWYKLSTLALETRNSYFYALILAGRWLAKHYPDINSPAQWTRALAAEYISAVNNMCVGEYSNPSQKDKVGQPISSWAKSNLLSAIRTAFQDWKDWDKMDSSLKPKSAFRTPKSISSKCQPQSRQIDDESWAKLMMAGIQLTAEQVNTSDAVGNREHWYPIEMVRALALIWIFCGLRADDIRNLRVGCIRPDHNMAELDLCSLDVAPGKTGVAHIKSVPLLVGNAIQVWEKIRPKQAPLKDRVTGKRVHFLFAYRGQRLGYPYLNETLIPMLCEIADVPLRDVEGRKITSHRAKHTILSQLSDTMTIPELQSWSGHKSISALNHYIKSPLKKQAEAYQKSDYFKNNLRTAELSAQGQVKTSQSPLTDNDPRSVSGGICTYDFPEECQNRSACSQCSFFQPTHPLLTTFQQHLQNLEMMLNDESITPEQRRVIEEEIQRIQSQCEQLNDAQDSES